MNASDTRGKADAAVVKGVGGKLANAVKELSTNRAVSYDVHGRRKKVRGGMLVVVIHVAGVSVRSHAPIKASLAVSLTGTPLDGTGDSFVTRGMVT